MVLFLLFDFLFFSFAANTLYERFMEAFRCAVRCIVHFYRNVFSVVPKAKIKHVALMLKAIHAQESREAALKKVEAVVEELKSMKLKEAAKKVCDSFEETLTYMSFPSFLPTHHKKRAVISDNSLTYK